MAARVHPSHNLNYASNSIEMKAKLEDSVANAPQQEKHFDGLRSVKCNIGIDWLIVFTLGYSCVFDCECVCRVSVTTCRPWSQTRLPGVPPNVQKCPPGMFCWRSATVIPSCSISGCELIFGTDIFQQFLPVKNATFCKISLVANDLPFK